ncbi:MAG TPA: D-alanyl-D-alanine carboxypeptidase family protein [Beijerinckiaceae bacterium]|nr:D-alanyl-D-alanine carboxypeptidase family protein [Beijerinckiaceae bacterium]HVB89175.1 D-alanyl-D-alanine carboxypeptidase family protein [Beijerinckiaceae bacterium]
MLGVSGQLKKVLVAFGGVALAFAVGMGPAEAWHHRHLRHFYHHHHHHHHARRHHARRAVRRHIAYRPYAPPFAAVMVDANTGRTLYAVNENAPRHPASLTKVMTLYLLFEQLAKGRMSLNTRIEVSPHAASMEPTKLGLAPGSTISVDSAIRSIVTKSANDMAVAIAESIGGSESHFAQLMTAKARSLGMYHTQYVNASGLPNPGQLTTAHDLALLGQAIQAKFPQYYHYFSIPSFTYHGQFMANHDHLLRHYPGVDGMKTGFTDASGFNLLTSLRHDGRHVVAVVLGGPSWRIRDNIMEAMLDKHMAEASTRRSASMIAENTARDRDDHAKAGVRVTPVAYAPTERALPAYVASAPRAADDETPTTGSIARRMREGATRTEPVSASTGSATPTPLRWVTGPAPARMARRKRAVAARPTQTASLVQPVRKPKARRVAAAEVAPVPHHPGVQIQIGATNDADQAADLLTRAKFRGRRILARATPYTEKFQKGGETFWRARFAGLNPKQAGLACRDLKRAGFACFTTRD